MSQTVTGQILPLPTHTVYLHLTLVHSKGQVNVMQIVTVAISKTLTDLQMHRKQPIGFRLVYLHLTLAHSCKFRLWLYRKWWEIPSGKILLLLMHRKSRNSFRLVYLHLTLTNSKGQGKLNFDWKKFGTESRCISPYISVYVAFSSCCYFKRGMKINKLQHDFCYCLIITFVFII